jgi:hypothetical protein
LRKSNLLVLVSFFACQQETQIQSTSQGILNGEPDNRASHIAVVGLSDAKYGAFCSGTYIGQRTVLTAGHCLENGPPAYIYFGPNSDVDGALCKKDPQNTTACPRFIPTIDFDDAGFSNDETLHNDLAVIKISHEPVMNSREVLPFPFIRFTDDTSLSENDEGSLVSFSGYGKTENNTFGAKLIVEDIPLTAVGPDVNISESIDEDQVFYSQTVNLGGPCSGDSGGPMFIQRGRVEFLAAVTSFGDAKCTEFGVSTRVDQFETFIDDFCGEAGCGVGSCGNDTVDNEEECDGEDLAGQDCESLGLLGGKLRCHSNCSFNIDSCTKPVGKEICVNNIDEDDDHDVDCADSDCAGNALCNFELLNTQAGLCSVNPLARGDSSLVAFGLFFVGLFFSRRKNLPESPDRRV